MPASTSLRIVLLVGLPGSGKSTWLEQRGLNALSSDALRALLADDEAEQGIHAQVFRTLRFLLRERLKIGRPVTYVDATHLTRWERRPYFPMAEQYGAKVEALWFDVPLEVCAARNRARERVVPARVLEQMARRFVRPALDEGFSRIRRVTPQRQSHDRP